MPDITTINYIVRQWLISHNRGHLQIELPQYSILEQTWIVLLTLNNRLVGTVILDENGKVQEEISYPNVKP